MINKSNKWMKGFLAAALLSVAALGCKKAFDEPPVFVEPDIEANTTIKELKAMHNNGAFEAITTEIIIEGIVVADDRTGNFYKSIAIQDETGGITIRLDGNNLYTTYPVGRKIYVKAKGLYMGDYNNLIQLGGGIDDSDPSQPELMPLASNLFDTYIVKGSTGNTVAPKIVTVAQLHDSLQSMLIQIEGAEFIVSDTSKTYADAVTNASRNLYVKACSGNSVILRSSGFANFAGVNVPNGNGPLTAIYTVFGSTKQLVIRDTSDVQFYGPRCGQGPTTDINISDLRALFTGTTLSIPDGQKIRGTVISDRVGNNQDDNNLVLQQATGMAGIMVRFEDPHSFDLGDSIEVNVSGQSLEEFNGTLQVNGVPNSYAQAVGTGSVQPRVTTVADINANFEAWESTLVTVLDAALSGGSGGNWSGSVNVSDGTGIIIAFTRSAATFSGTAYPPFADSLTGYLTQFNATNEMVLRNTDDAVAGSGGGSGTGLDLTTSPFQLNFDNIETGLPQGVYVKIGASASSLGTGDAPIYNSLAPTAWNQTSAGVKNYASFNSGLAYDASSGDQSSATNRALGVRQTGSTGWDPGASFVFQLENTVGKTNIDMSFDMQSLDSMSTAANPRETTWVIEYGFGDDPNSFTTVSTTPGTVTTSFFSFHSYRVTVDFGSALDNVNQKVWIRIAALTGSAGSGSRATTAIDDLEITWN